MLILLWHLFVDCWYKALYRHLPISSLKERFLPAMITLPLVEKIPADISTPIAWTPVSSLDIKGGTALPALPTVDVPSRNGSTDADYDAISHPRQHPIAVRNNIVRSIVRSLPADDLHVDDHDLPDLGTTIWKHFFTAHRVTLNVLDSDETKEPHKVLIQNFMSLLASFSGKFYRIRGWEQRKQFLHDVEQEIDHHV